MSIIRREDKKSSQVQRKISFIFSLLTLQQKAHLYHGIANPRGASLIMNIFAGQNVFVKHIEKQPIPLP